MSIGRGINPPPCLKATCFERLTAFNETDDGFISRLRQLISGFWIWRCQSLAEAIEWVRKCPNPMGDESEIEIRQIFGMEDFGAAMTPELREQEDRIRAQVEGAAEKRRRVAREAPPR